MLTKRIVDDLLSTNITWNVYLIIAYSVLLLFSIISSNVERYIAVKHNEIVGSKFRCSFFKRVLGKNYIEFNNSTYGDVETAMSSCIDDINDSAYCFVETIIVYPIGMLIGIAYISRISYWLLLILCGQLLLNYFIMHRGSIMLNKAQTECYQFQSRYFTVLSNLFHAYENIRLLWLQKEVLKKHEYESIRLANANKRFAKVSSIYISMFLELTDAVLNIVTIILFFYLIGQGISSVGSYLAFIAMKDAISGSFNGFIKLKANKAKFDAAFQQINSVEEVEEFLEYADIPEERVENASSAMVLSAVHYKYPDDEHEFIFDYSFTEGCYIIIGENGVGKTTFVRYIANLLQGEDGKSGVGYGKIRVLPQTINVFDESIIDIVIHKDTVFSEELALKLGVINQLKAIKDNKDNCAVVNSLSGGEKKKILLSILLSQKNSVLILDEPFAELDQKSKEVVATEICDYHKNQLLIIISHEIPLVLKNCSKTITIVKEEGISYLLSDS